MKKLHSLLLILICAALLCGCRHPKTGEATVPEEPVSEPVNVETDEIAIIETEQPVEAMAVATVPPTQAPTVDPTEAPTDAPTPVPAPEGPRYLAGNGIYTIAWMSDPQHYSKKFPESYYAMTSFLSEQREGLNLQYVINTGDLVHNTNDDAQWDVADRAQAMIDDIPNGVLAGNHDMQDPIGYQTFSKRFGEKRYQNKPWYGGSFENNRGHYDLLTVGETDYLFVYMGFAPSEKAIKWVRDVFKQYPDRVGALCLHDYYTKALTLSEDGQRWYDQVVKQSPNLYMVFCGHKYGSYCFPEAFDDDGDGKADRTVYQMLFNYQASLHDGGGGYLRLMQIDEANGTMTCLTYSPLLEDFNRFDDPENREDYYPFDEKNEEYTVPLPWKIDN